MLHTAQMDQDCLAAGRVHFMLWGVPATKKKMKTKGDKILYLKVLDLIAIEQRTERAGKRFQCNIWRK